MVSIREIEELHVWQSARNLALSIDCLLKSGALEGNKELKTQIQRASISVTSNIAEGFGRGGNREFINYLSIARGSLAEVKSQLILAFDFKCMGREEYESILRLIEDTGKLIGGLTRHLKRSSITGSKYRY